MKFLFFLIFLSLISCTYKFSNPTRGSLPTSSVIYSRSSTTNLPVNQPYSFNIIAYKGIADSKILGYKIPANTLIKSLFAERPNDIAFKYYSQELYPGTVWVGKDLLIDEAEVANVSWKEFLFYIQKDSIKSYYNKMEPENSVLPRMDYFENPFFHYYPVVGITYEQALEYCIWRTKVTSKALNEYFASRNFADSIRFKIKYRLPTNEEWETIAACRIELNKYPYGVENISASTKVSSRSAKYFKVKNNLSESLKTIKYDINDFNRKKPEMIMFNCKKQVPQFLAQKTPNYIYDLPIDNFGIFHMIGNVSEMVQEKGITKGGSFLQDIQDCKILNNRPYLGPAQDLGFRCICEIYK